MTNTGRLTKEQLEELENFLQISLAYSENLRERFVACYEQTNGITLQFAGLIGEWYGTDVNHVLDDNYSNLFDLTDLTDFIQHAWDCFERIISDAELLAEDLDW